MIFVINSKKLSDFKFNSAALHNVVKIADKKLFREKVSNNDKRRNLLMVTGRLRATEGFENDLTYRQR